MLRSKGIIFITSFILLAIISSYTVAATVPLSMNNSHTPILGIFSSISGFFNELVNTISHIFSPTTISTTSLVTTTINIVNTSTSATNGNVVNNNGILPFSGVLTPANYTLPSLSNYLNQKVGSLQQLNVTYTIGWGNESGRSIYLNFTYEQYGDNYKVDLSNATSNLTELGILRDSNGHIIANNYTMTSFFRIDGQNYACTNRDVCLNLSSPAVKSSKLNQTYYYQKLFTLPVLNLTIFGLALGSSEVNNSTLVSTAQRTYMGNSCTFILANFTVVTGSSRNTTTQKWSPTFSPELAYATCLSNEYYVPLNYSLLIPNYSGQGESYQKGVGLPTKVLSIGKPVSQKYVTTLPYRLINSTTPIASINANPSNFSGEVTVIGVLYNSNLVAPINYEVVDNQGYDLKLQLPSNRKWTLNTIYAFTGTISCGIIINKSEYNAGTCGTLQTMQNDADYISSLNGNINVTPYISMTVTNATITGQATSIISTSTSTSFSSTTTSTVYPPGIPAGAVNDAATGYSWEVLCPMYACNSRNGQPGNPPGEVGLCINGTIWGAYEKLHPNIACEVPYNLPNVTGCTHDNSSLGWCDRFVTLNGSCFSVGPGYTSKTTQCYTT
jgi:hypothetical protein